MNGNAREKAHLWKIRSRAFQLFKDFDATQDPQNVWYMRTLKAYVTLVERGHDGNRYSLVGSDAALATKNLAIDVLLYIFEGVVLRPHHGGLFSRLIGDVAANRWIIDVLDKFPSRAFDVQSVSRLRNILAQLDYHLQHPPQGHWNGLDTYRAGTRDLINDKS